jgi:tetratricopeptide (TPR) repeat protein
VRTARSIAIAAFAALLAFGVSNAAAEGAFDDGERLYRENKPAAAVPLLEQAILAPGTDQRAWLYLSNCYQQLGRVDEASAVLRKGLAQATTLKYLYYFNLGTNFILQNKYTFASDMLSQAIDSNGAYSPALLLRANVRLSLKDYANAKADYLHYLDLEPASPQRASIEEIIKRLDAGIAEADKAAAVAEAKKQADGAAKQQLMDQMSASLKAAADETTSISAGAGNVQGYGDELKLDE